MSDQIEKGRPDAAWAARVTEWKHEPAATNQFRSAETLRPQPDAGEVERLAPWLTTYTLAVQEAERRRIASDLHDGLGQALSFLLIDLRNARHAMNGGGAESAIASASIERMSAGVRAVVEELRRSVMALYPSILDDLGLGASLSWVLRDMAKAQPGLRIDSRILVTDAEVPVRMHITVFRIVQEAVNNVLKHANAKTLTVVLGGGANALALVVKDDGCGISDSALGKPAHTGGLNGMMHRAHASGGAFEIASSYDSGTCITITWPRGCVS